MAMYKNIVDNTHASNQRMLDLAQSPGNAWRLRLRPRQVQRATERQPTVAKEVRVRSDAPQNAPMMRQYKT